MTSLKLKKLTETKLQNDIIQLFFYISFPFKTFYYPFNKLRIQTEMILQCFFDFFQLELTQF